MRALQLIAPGHFTVTNLPIPKLEADEILIKVHYAGICGSDIHIFHGRNPRVKYPVVLGHEFSGQIAEMSGNSNLELKVGDFVTINPLLSCGKCEPCMSGRKNTCRNFGLYGIDTDGGFAEYVRVNAKHVLKLPSGLPMDVAALAEPFAVGLHAVRRSGLQIGDKVLILGAGPIGLLVALAAKAAGAGSIVLCEKNKYRLEIANRLGFATVNPAVDDVKKTVDEQSNGNGMDVVFEAAAAPATSLIMTSCLKAGGTAVMVGLHREAVPVDLRDVNLRELHIIGTMVYNPVDFSTSVEMLGQIQPIVNLISHRLPLEAHNEAFASIINGNDVMKVLLYPDSEAF